MKPIAVTIGMGIGPEVTLKSLAHFKHPTHLFGRRGALMDAVEASGMDWSVLWSNPNVQVIEVDDSEIPAEVRCIQLAASGCLSGQYSAMVTGPINKYTLMNQGFSFPGHTDYLAHLCEDTRAVMAFRGQYINVVLVTTHIPIQEVPAALSQQRIVETIQVAHQAWSELIERPRFVVCGLNPHAGEQGKIGTEEVTMIQPACQTLQAMGLNVSDVMSAETAFMKARRKEVDVVVAMYHDQGLAPLKLLEFGQAVNWTQGLPIIRTSVDHGTAEDLVGLNQANPESLIAAWDLAHQIASKRYSGQSGRDASDQTASKEVSSPTHV